MAKGPLGSRRCVKSSRRKGLRLNPTEMAGRRGWPRISPILNLRGHRDSADIWTPSPRSISPTQQRTSKDYDTRTRSPKSATIIVTLVRCRIVRITSLLRELLQVYKLEKDVNKTLHTQTCKISTQTHRRAAESKLGMAKPKLAISMVSVVTQFHLGLKFRVLIV